MARVFLDTNKFIDLAANRTTFSLETLRSHDIFISPLSIHIYLYVYKEKVPLNTLSTIVAQLYLKDFSGEIADKALAGPTNDFEDNVQLHSAAEAECDFFLTSDEKLLAMKFFGKVELAATPSTRH